MLKTNKDAYDAVIIGAGISGLVCACYLAKGGMKILLVEQHHKTGGYCTSFKRKNYNFDAAAHSFGSYREGGIMRKILRDLEVDKKLGIRRYDPSDIILAPGYKISFWADNRKTISELQVAFPHEAAGISSFFHFLQRFRSFSNGDLAKQNFQRSFRSVYYRRPVKSDSFVSHIRKWWLAIVTDFSLYGYNIVHRVLS